MSDEGQLRALLAEYGGWVYFREEDPANPLRARRREAGARTPPGRYREVCRVCGAYREDGHRATCEIGRALTEVAA